MTTATNAASSGENGWVLIESRTDQLNFGGAVAQQGMKIVQIPADVYRVFLYQHLPDYPTLIGYLHLFAFFLSFLASSLIVLQRDKSLSEYT